MVRRNTTPDNPNTSAVFIPPSPADLDRLALTGAARETAVRDRIVGWYAPEDWKRRGALWCVELLLGTGRGVVRFRVHALTDSPQKVPDVAAAYEAQLSSFGTYLGVMMIVQMPAPRVDHGIALVQEVIDFRTVSACVNSR